MVSVHVTLIQKLSRVALVGTWEKQPCVQCAEADILQSTDGINVPFPFINFITTLSDHY